MFLIRIENYPKAQWSGRTAIGGQEARLTKELRLVCVYCDVLGSKIFDQVKVEYQNEHQRGTENTIRVHIDEQRACPLRTSAHLSTLANGVQTCIEQFIPEIPVKVTVNQHEPAASETEAVT